MNVDGKIPNATISQPVNLMKYLVGRHTTKPGQLVMDPFMGTGTTGMGGALEADCAFIGIEKDESTFFGAVHNVARSMAEMRMV